MWGERQKLDTTHLRAGHSYAHINCPELYLCSGLLLGSLPGVLRSCRDWCVLVPVTAACVTCFYLYQLIMWAIAVWKRLVSVVCKTLMLITRIFSVSFL